MAVRVQSGLSSNLAGHWAIPNLTDFPIGRTSQSGDIPNLALLQTKSKFSKFPKGQWGNLKRGSCQDNLADNKKLVGQSGNLA